jgi:hypothetical protein
VRDEEAAGTPLPPRLGAVALRRGDRYAADVISNFLDLVSRRGRREYPQEFIRSVNLRRTESESDRKLKRLLWIFWGVILVKCAFIWWLMRHYHVPIHPLWVVVPTLMFAALITAVYVWRD